MTGILARLKTALADRYTIEHELGAGGQLMTVKDGLRRSKTISPRQRLGPSLTVFDRL